MSFFYLVKRFSINVPKLSNSEEKLGLLTLIDWKNNLSWFRDNLKHDWDTLSITKLQKSTQFSGFTVSPLPSLSNWATELYTSMLHYWQCHGLLFLIKYMLKSWRELITRVFNAERYSFCTTDFENKIFKMAQIWELINFRSYNRVKLRDST